MSPKIKVDMPVAGNLYKPLMSFTSKAGTYNPDVRLSGSHEAVKLNPELFVEVGLSDAAEAAAFESRFGPEARRFFPSRAASAPAASPSVTITKA